MLKTAENADKQKKTVSGTIIGIYGVLIGSFLIFYFNYHLRYNLVTPIAMYIWILGIMIFMLGIMFMFEDKIMWLSKMFLPPASSAVKEIPCSNQQRRAPEKNKPKTNTTRDKININKNI